MLNDETKKQYSMTYNQNTKYQWDTTEYELTLLVN